MLFLKLILPIWGTIFLEIAECRFLSPGAGVRHLVYPVPCIHPLVVRTPPVKEVLDARRLAVQRRLPPKRQAWSSTHAIAEAPGWWKGFPDPVVQSCCPITSRLVCPAANVRKENLQ